MTKTPKWFQKLFYRETLMAIKCSLRFFSYDEFRDDLILLLPQPSEKSRIRIVNNILYRFFPDKKLYTLPAQVWQAYGNDFLLREILRYEFLKNEPVIVDFLLNYLFKISENKYFSPDIFKKFISQTYGKENMNLTWWLQGAMKDLGFVLKEKNIWKINDIRKPKTALIILIHSIFANYPNKINYHDILNHNFWKLIGIKNQESLCSILKEADFKNLIRFNGETVETIYTLEILMAMKPDLD